MTNIIDFAAKRKEREESSMRQAQDESNKLSSAVLNSYVQWLVNAAMDASKPKESPDWVDMIPSSQGAKITMGIRGIGA